MRLKNLLTRHKPTILVLVTLVILILVSGRIGPEPVAAQTRVKAAPNAAFTAGNVVVYRVGTGPGGLNSNATAVFLDEFTPTGALVQSIAMPVTVNGSNKRLTAVGNSTAEGFLSRSANGQFLLVPGYDAPLVPGSISSTQWSAINRVIGRVDAAGNVDTTTALADSGLNANPRGATSTNGTDLWITSAGAGIRYASFGSTTSSPVSESPGTIRGVEVFGGQLYVSVSVGSVQLATVGSGTPTTSGETITNLPGFPTTGNRYGFFFADLSSSVAGLDTVYSIEEGQIQKFSLVSGSWVPNGFFPITLCRGLAGTVTGSVVTLYVTTGTTPATLQKFVDSSGYNSAITGIQSIIATGGTGTAFRGVAMAPVNAVPTDTTAPTISYSPLVNTNSTGNRVVTATIADAVGVAGGALLPRIYFRKDNGSYFSTQCSLSSGNAQSGTYSCTINNSLVGGVAAGNKIDYFVVAQDAAGNVASSPAGVVATSVNAITTPPVPNSYLILTSNFAGAFNVGSGEAISSLTNEGGLFQLMNAGSLSGNVVINITADLTAESGTYALNQQVETGAGGYTVFFQASGAARLIEGSNANALISLNGADRVTFSGLAFGPRGLTFRNTSNGSTIRLANDASGNSILNCAVEGQETSTFDSGVVSISTGTTTGNDNNTISDSTIRSRSDVFGSIPKRLISIQGTPLIRNSNTAIVNNSLINYTADAILILDSEDSTVNANDIYWTDPLLGGTGATGISLIDAPGSNSVSQNKIHDAGGADLYTGMFFLDSGTTIVARNRVYNIDDPDGAIVQLIGIDVSGSSAATTTTFENNMIALDTDNASDATVLGFRDTRTAGTLNLSFNSIYLGGSGGAGDSWAFLRRNFGGGVGDVTLTGNILLNDRIGSGNGFAVGDQANGSPWTSNYNLFIGKGTTSANFFDFGGPVDFAAWKTGPPARDANSRAGVAGSAPYDVASIFASTNDLHLLVSGSNPAINAGGTAGPSVDFDGQTRPFGSALDIGADEVQTAPTAAEVSLSGRVVTAEGRGIRGIRIVVSGGDLPSPVAALTGAFGYYHFDGLRAGRTYVVSVSGKRYVFETPARAVTLGDSLSDVDFVGTAR